MGYFSNGTEGLGFQEVYCDRCLNSDHKRPGAQTDTWGCAVWDAHLLANYHQHPEHAKTDEERGGAFATRALLGILIRQTEGGNQCRMYREDPHHDQTKLPL